MLGLIALLFHVAGLGLAVHAVMSTRTSQGAIAWTVSLVSFPYVAVPAYLVLGRSKFNGYVTARQLDAAEPGRDWPRCRSSRGTRPSF
jgi:cardiolipin synthase